jgi:serine phosphatase RsbU (regulator of sigma subunit)
MLASAFKFDAMLSRFHGNSATAPPVTEPAPTVFPQIEGADIAAVFVGKRIAGDFYDSIRVSPERVLIGLLDVAGRREDNRGLLVAAQEVFRTLGFQLFSPADINESDAMTELCHRINRRLIEVCCGVHSCPAFLACYHQQFGTLCYTNAGHTPALLHDTTGIAELASTGLPLGLFSHATAESPTVALAKQASLLLVSRGVIECEGRGNSSSPFGLERVKDVLRGSSPFPSASALCNSVLKAVADYTANASVCDDRTALALLRPD